MASASGWLESPARTCTSADVNRFDGWHATGKAVTLAGLICPSEASCEELSSSRMRFGSNTASPDSVADL